MLNERMHVAVPTAFFADESLNIDGTVSHIKRLYQQGIKSVLVSGSTGEQHSLSLQEKLQIVEALDKEGESISSMEIIFGVSAVRQKEAEMLAERIQSSQIAGIMLGFPPYVKPTQEEGVAYAKSIIKRSGKPAILYNNPGRTGFDLSGESIVQLSEIDMVIGVKDAGSKEKIEQIKQSPASKKLYFYAGGEEDLAEKTGYGYDRLSSIAGNVWPEEIHSWFQKLVEKKDVTSQEREQISNLKKQVYDGNAIMNVKKILNDRGDGIGVCRKPIGNLHDSD